MVTRSVLFLAAFLGVASYALQAQTNTIQLRNGAQTTTILPSNNTVRIQIPDIPDGQTVYLNTSNVAPVTTTGGGGLLYGTPNVQNSLGLSTGGDNPYLFYVSYSSASDGAALGARITSTANGANYAATGLTIGATATGTGDASGLTLSATSPSGRADALTISSGRLRINGTSNFLTLRATTLGGDYEYIWPTDSPGTNEVLKVTSVSGNNVALEWGVGAPEVTVDAGTSTNSTLRWTGTKWAENTGVASNATDLTVSGGRVTSQTATFTNTTSQLILGTTNTTTISSVAPSLSRTYTIPDAGADASFVMTAGTQTVGGNKTFSGTTSINGGASAAEVRFYEPSGSGTNYSSFKAQAQALDIIYTLPLSDGSSGYVLTTNGSGSLAWVASPGAMSLDALTDAKVEGDQFLKSIIVGHQTTGSLGGASYNSAFGLAALDAISSGDFNTVVGYDAGGLISSASDNTLVGFRTGSGLSGNSNTGVGSNALYGSVTGTGNIAMGLEAGYSITSGQYNIAIGHKTMRTTAGVTGSYNLGIGYQALDKVTSGNYNVAVGSSASTALTSGASNVLIGYNAGSGLITGGSNVFIGYNVGSAAASDASSLLYIDNSNTATPLIQGDFASDALTVNGTLTSTGDVTLGSGSSTTGGSIIMHDNATGTSYTATIMSANLSASRTYTIPDAGADGSFVMTAGSNLSGYTTGDILYASASNTLSKLGIGGPGQVLTISGGVPVWGSGMPSGTTTNSTLRYSGSAWVENLNTLSTSDGTLTLKATSNQVVLGGTGGANTTTITSPTPAGSSRTYTVPDAGANASFVMTEGSQTINGTKTIGGVVVAAPGSQTVVPGATGSPGAITAFTGLYNTITVNNPADAAKFIKLPQGTANGQIAYVRLAFSGSNAAYTVTVRNWDDVNTATVYDGVGNDVIIMHLIYDTVSSPARWLVVSSTQMP